VIFKEVTMKSRIMQFVIALVAITVVFSVSSCDKDPELLEPKEIVLQDGTISLVLFQSKKIVVNDSAVAGKKLIYTSSNENVATVSDDGVVTGVGVPHGVDLNTSIPAAAAGTPMFGRAYGMATVNVKTTDGKYEANVPIYVTMLGYEDVSDLPSLYQQFQPYIPNFGTTNSAVIASPPVTVADQRWTKHFNILTPENNQKPQYYTVTPAPTADNIAAIASGATPIALANATGDNLVVGAINAGFKWHYHVLLWHEQNQAWWGTVIGGTGTNNAGTTSWNPALDKATAEKVMKVWIDTIMNRNITVGGASRPLKEVVYSWDVINEMILSFPERLTARTVNGTYQNVGTMDRPTQTVTGRGNWVPHATPGATLRAWGDPQFTWRDALRYGNSDEEFWDSKRQGSAWVRALGGEDAIYLAYKYARLNAPNAILYVNDYDTFYPNKAKLIYDCVVDLNARWAADPDNTTTANPNRTPLINAMGMQEHNNIEVTTVEGIEYNLNLWTSIPNMKIAITELDLRVYDWGGNSTVPTLQEQVTQAKLYGEMFRLYLKYSKNSNGSNIERITFWGYQDMNNWMSAGRPLLFDGGNTTAISNAKPAYYLVQRMLSEHAAANP
jgi:GH35 family endo-1,4-beta-xylanase